MYFQVLQLRLIALLKGRVRNGEITERRLAFVTGVSQPHIHNVLKGARMLSPEIADQILECLKLSIFDLFQQEEMASHHEPGGAGHRTFEEVPVLEGRVGPGYAYPDRISQVERFPVLRAQLATANEPVVGRLGADEHMTSLFARNDVVLLDRFPRHRISPVDGRFYVIRLDDTVAVRRLRLEDDWFLASTTDGIVQPLGPLRQPRGSGDMLDKVLAKVLWIGRDMEHPDSAGEADQKTGGSNRSAGRER